jgi:hypothetical protein
MLAFGKTLDTGRVRALRIHRNTAVDDIILGPGGLSITISNGPQEPDPCHTFKPTGPRVVGGRSRRTPEGGLVTPRES